LSDAGNGEAVSVGVQRDGAEQQRKTHRVAEACQQWPMRRRTLGQPVADHTGRFWGFRFRKARPEIVQPVAPRRPPDKKFDRRGAVAFCFAHDQKEENETHRRIDHDRQSGMCTGSGLGDSRHAQTRFT
jgi:hypothetical protein